MKKVISMIVAIAMLVAMFSTVINLGTAFAAQDYTASGQNVPAGMLGWTQNATSFTTLASTGFTAQIDSVSGKSGETITVPMKFTNVPSKGIMTFDMTLLYDSTKLEYVGGEAGSIVKNASSNFEINKEEDGKLRLLYLDMTVGDEYINTDGTVVNIKFNVKTSASTTTTISVSKGTFGDIDLNPVTTTIIDGVVSLNGSVATNTPVVVVTPTPVNTFVPSGFTAQIASVSGEAGQTITVPLNIYNVPSKGVMTFDLAITYDASKLEYVSGEAGSIVTNPKENFEINKEEDGKLRVLFLDMSVGDACITSDGTLVNMKFDVKTSSKTTTTITVNKGTFGDIDLNGIKTNYVDGVISLNGGVIAPATSTPVPVTPTPTIPKTATPVPGTPTPVKTYTATGFTAQIESVSGKVGETINVPLYLLKVPSSGVMAGDMTIIYDASKLEFVGAEAGSIVKNASENFELNKETDGLLRLLYLDMTVGDQCITSDGIFVTMQFKVKTSEAVSTVVSATKGTFGDADLNAITTKYVDGVIALNGGGPVVTPSPVVTPTPTKTFIATGFTALIDSVSGKVGGRIDVPLYILNVPSKGVMTCDLTITYDASVLEYVSGEAGSIVKNASENFEINKEEDGKLRLLYLDMTVGEQYITSDGILVNLRFNVKASTPTTTTIRVVKGTFGDIDLQGITTKYVDGVITLNGGNGGGPVQTPTPTKTEGTRTPTPTPTPTPISTAVVSNLKVEFYNTNTQADSNSIYPKFRLTNTGSSPINLADLKLRYYYTIDGEKSQTFWCDWSPVGSSNVTGKFEKLSPAVTGADYYLEISFSSGAGTLAPNTPIEVQGRFAKSDWTNYNQANDYSFNSSATNYTTWDKVTAYLNGKLVWGKEPNGSVSTPTPTPTTIVTITPTPTKVVTNTPNPNSMTVTIGTVQGAPGQAVSVPVSIAKVPSSGVTTFDMTITYDSSVLEYVSYEPGSIIKNPSENFEINKEEDGKLKALFLDMTVENESITADGIIANLNFKIKSSAKAGTSASVETAGKSTFGDPNLSPIPAVVIGGKVEIIDASATKLTIGKVTGKAGSEVAVPLTLEGVPEVGITTGDMTIVYDTSILEYVGYEAGSIVKSANENLEINKEEDGKLRVLYLDMTVGDESIEQDGVFATLKFKIKSSAANGAVAEISRSGKATFGDKDINPISVTIINGSVTVGEASTTTPTPTAPVTSTPTPTAPVTSTPTAPVETGSRVVIETVEANPGSSVAVPVKLYGVPSSGVMTADMAIIYDTSKLEYINYEAGSIVTNAKVNLEVNKEEDGLLRVLFLDDTVGDQLITKDGVFFTLNFNVKSTAAVGSTAEVAVRDNKATFGDEEANPIKFAVENGKVKVVKAADPDSFKVAIGTVDGVKGQEVIVPITLSNVPASGIMASDGVIEYDATKLEYVTYTPGSMIANPSTDFEINKEEDGKLKLLFLDYSVGDHLITEDGVFATVVFKVLGDEGLTEITFKKITFGDADAEGVEVVAENGGVNIGSKPVGFTVSGYINPDFMTTSTTAPIVNAGFKVELVGTGKTAVTDSNGYFEIKDVPAGTYKVKITKDNYLAREIADVQVSGNKELSTSEQPILLWAGDMIIDGAQDGAINLEDIMEICKSFNTTSSDSKYKADSDLNKDGAINLEDVMIVAKHFNKVSSDYK